MDFSRILVHTAAAAAVTVAFSGAVFAADDATELKLGEMEYMSQCASCHGPKGHGDGPVAAVLKTAPPDLTMITSRYSGTFPTDQIVMMIDGRNMINPHGDRNMPVWGDRYFTAAVERAQSVPHDVDAQAMALGRVTALVSYLESIQAE